METRLECDLSVPSGFYKFLVKARNPETAKFIDAPYIEGCALTKEWIRYEIVN